MRLTTVGSGTISLTPGRVCSGHVVEAGDARVLLDCGSGVMHRMSALGIDWWNITHLALTHFHTDHIGDLPSAIFAWKWARIPSRQAPLTIIGPRGTRALLRRLAAAHGPWLTAPGFPLMVRELAPGATLGLESGVWLSTTKVPHTPESMAYSIERGRGRIVYTGDCGYDERVAGWARGSDVWLCECSLPASMAIPSHLTPEQCGALAAIARPKLLALTHLYPPLEQVNVTAVVRAAFAGTVAIATDGWTTEIEDG